MDKKYPQKITNNEQIEFAVNEFGLYAISITASCEKNNDLRIEIDEKQFREIPASENIQTYNIPPAWNGATLKGLKKTVVFLLKLNKGKHTLKFFPKSEASLEDFNYKIISNYRKIDFNFEERAQDGDGRPWITFSLVDLSLISIIAESSVSWHWFDGDDVKLIIDNRTEENSLSKRWKYWVWHAIPIQIFSGSKRKQRTFLKNLPLGTHYIEFWADKTPTLHQVSLDLGDFELKRTPTRDDPKWTGDFIDDTDTILLARLILGEMEGRPRAAKLGAGFTVINRLEKSKANWGRSIQEIILKENQYDAFHNEKTRNKVRDPLGYVDKSEWEESYAVAVAVLEGTEKDPTAGATHFYSTNTDTRFPRWANKETFRVKINVTYFYELES